MLAVEKIISTLVLLACVFILVDLNTPWVNRLWEATLGSTDRYAINQEGKIGYINGRGKTVIKPRFQEAPRHFKDGLQPVLAGELWGYIDVDGSMPIEPKFYWAQGFSNGLALVSQHGDLVNRYGYINPSGEYVLPPKFLQAREFSKEGLAAAESLGKWGYIDQKGEWVLSPQFEEAQSFHEGMAAVRVNGKWGFINHLGNAVVVPQFDAVKTFSQGLAPVKTNGLWGYVDGTGTTIVQPQYEFADVFSEGLAAVKGLTAQGYINTTGHIAFKAVYFSELRQFSEGWAAVRVNAGRGKDLAGKWGYVDKKGKFVIDPKFDSAWDFEAGLARVTMNRNDVRRGYVNKKGRLIWDPADWEQSSYLRRIFWNTLIVGVCGYLVIYLRYYRRKKLEDLYFSQTIG